MHRLALREAVTWLLAARLIALLSALLTATPALAAAPAPATIPSVLQGRIVVPADGRPALAAYQVTGGRASMDSSGDWVLEVDVFLIAALQSQPGRNEAHELMMPHALAVAQIIR